MAAPLNTLPAPALTIAIAGGRAEASVSNALPAQASPLAATPPSIPTPSGLQLSPLARGLMDLIGDLLPSPVNQGRPASLPQTGTALFMDGMPPEALQQALKQQIESSGLFYESHLRQMTAGTRTPAQLREEPQGQLPPQSPPTPGQPTALPTEAKPLVQAQLQFIEQQALLWRGEAWPGIPLEWRIEREPPERDSPQETTGERAWQMQLNLDFPALGALHARLRYQAGEINITLQGDTPEDFQTALPALLQRLNDRGLKAQIHVRTAQNNTQSE